MFEVRDLVGVRSERRLFENLSFSVRENELLYISGRNGSGKTTLLRILCGLARPESGEILWHGVQIEEIETEYAQSLVYVGHENGIKGDLTVIENLAFDRVLRGNPTIQTAHKILDRLGIERYAQIPCRYLSAGQKRRVALARLQVSNARLWLLDEPFTALDEPTQEIIIDWLSAHLESGGICITTSHQPINWSRLNASEIKLGEQT